MGDNPKCIVCEEEVGASNSTYEEDYGVVCHGCIDAVEHIHLLPDLILDDPSITILLEELKDE